MSFFHLRIRGRLYSGFGALLLFCSALAGFAVLQLWEVRGHIEDMTMQSQNAIRLSDIATELQAARRAILRYAFDQDEASFVESEKRLARTKDLLEDAAKTTTSEQRRAAYQDAAKNVAELKTKRAELGDAVKQMLAGRNQLFADGDKMAADVQKFVEAADKTDFVREASILETKVLLVRVANWRMLATRDPKGLETFKNNVGKAQQQIAEIEKANLPPNLAALLATVKTGVIKYAEAFDKTAPNLVLGDQLYYKAITPVIATTIEKMDGEKASVGEYFKKVSEDANSRINSTISMQETVASGVVLFGLLIAFLIARGIVNPITGMTAAMGKLAGGDTSAVIPSRERSDEIGEMAVAVQVFKDNMIEAEQLRGEQAEIEQRQAQRRQADMNRMADDFEGAVGQIIETVSSASTELEASASTLTSTAERTQELTIAVAAASREASTNVQSVASATEEMASSVNEISRQVQESARMAGDAVEQAQKTNHRVGELSKAASRIGDVVELINTIAGQTNLLALNATIEAARAGEAGRGFAVVASEVKALAEQTAKATGEISQQIKGIQDATDESVAAIQEIGNTIGRMSEIASTIAAAVEQQGAASQEISRNVQQAAQGTQLVSANITDVQGGASETGTASSQVFSAAQSLSSESNRLKLEVGKFLNTVRVA